MPQQARQPLHDRQAQPEAPAALARGIVDLMEFLEDRLQLIILDTDAGVPDLDADVITVPAAAQQHLALAGIFHRVAQQVADDLFQKPRVAFDMGGTGQDAQGEPARLCHIGRLVAQVIQHIRHGEVGQLGIDRAGLDLVDVEQHIQHARQRPQRLIEPGQQAFGPLATDGLRQQFLQQGQRLQRLAQIVAGGGEKARFGEIGALGLQLCRLQRGADAPAIGDVGKGDDHAFHQPVMRPVGEYASGEPDIARGGDLAVDRRFVGQNLPRIGEQQGVIRDGAQIGQRPADVAGDDIEQRADEFFFRGEQFLVGGLELLVDRQCLLVDRLLLLRGDFAVLNGDLQFGLRRFQLALQPSEAGGIGGAPIRGRLRIRGRLVDEADQQQLLVGLCQKLNLYAEPD